MKTLIFIFLILTSCGVQKPTVPLSEMKVILYLPEDLEGQSNYDSDTTYYNVYNVTYKKTEVTQMFILGVNYGLENIVSLEDLSKIDTLQLNVRLKDVNNL